MWELKYGIKVIKAKTIIQENVFKTPFIFKIRQKIKKRKVLQAQIQAVVIDEGIKSKVKNFIETKFVSNDILKKTFNIVQSNNTKLDTVAEYPGKATL